MVKQTRPFEKTGKPPGKVRNIDLTFNYSGDCGGRWLSFSFIHIFGNINSHFGRAYKTCGCITINFWNCAGERLETRWILSAGCPQNVPDTMSLNHVKQDTEVHNEA